MVTDRCEGVEFDDTKVAWGEGLGRFCLGVTA